MNYHIIFQAIVGSQSYGLATETSDIDLKGVYIQDEADILSNKYVPQIEVSKDYVLYELRRFLELVSTGNPNVLELLYLPKHCIQFATEEWYEIMSVREQFLTKQCASTYSGYARSQLQKASGLNKKINWEKEKIEKKDVIDFCKIIDRKTGLSSKLYDWLLEAGFTQDQCGLVNCEGFRDIYKLYTDSLSWAKANHRFTQDFSDRGYNGIIKDDSHEPRLSEIEKYRINDWEGVVYFNREEYSKHCKNWKEYNVWLDKRNIHRYATNIEHGQTFDSKNILHLVRLIMTAKEIPLQKRINVDRTEQREYLLSIKRGEVNLKDIIDQWTNEANNLTKLYADSDLPEEVNSDFVRNFELKLRKWQTTK